ncbi:MAG: ATP-binding cassette domain-containing protein [Planctomycetaceae bacterium]|nr:ATP-binding cassette domain-containing protein [Planctomycetaceae bacterium]
MALIALRDVSLGFRGPLVLDQVSLTLEPGERVCLLGRNGTGKSTLLRLIQGDIDTPQGEVTRQQGLVTAMLPQEVPRGLSGTVFDEVARGLGPKAELLAQYHHVAHQLTLNANDELRARLDRIQHALETQDGWSMNRQVESILSRMSLNPDANVADLSAGLKRRVLLARALVRSPDVLLLDEPTNHLDTDAIGWLEEFLLRCSATILFVTHDRALLRKLATRIIDLDRGRLTSWACDYETYLQRKEAALEAEARQRAEFDKKLAKEEVWIRTGIQARRTRNEGRVRALQHLRSVRSVRRDQPGEVRMEMQEAERSGRLVIEAKNVSFSYDNRRIVDDLSTMIMRGDRVGLIGPNGSGKTTLLRLLLGQLPPQTGAIRHGANLDVAYFDQLHAQLDDAKSVRDNVRDGADSVEINGRRRHIIGYLEDFLFTPEQAAAPVSRLSGGERNRLLLARLLTKPSNVLVMDEPTNDLDIETLELLENLLAEYPGTLLLVSHDREFLNNVVTSTLVLEGEGRVKEYAGAYDDWLRQRQVEALPEKIEPAKERNKPTAPRKDRPRRLTYAEQRELDALPEQIGGLEAQLAELHRAMAEPAFYRQDPAEIVAANAQLQSFENDLAAAYQRWETLEALLAQSK